MGYLVITSIALLFIKERVPVAKKPRFARQMRERRSLPLAFLRKSPFWAFAGVVALTSSGGFLPSIYIPTYAVDIGLGPQAGTILISLINISGVPGLLLWGYLSDRIPFKIVIASAASLASISVFLFFGFARSFPMLCLFAVVFSFAGLGMGALCTRYVSICAQADDNPALPSTIFGILYLIRGAMNASSGPIGNALLSSTALSNAKYGYGTGNYVSTAWRERRLMLTSNAGQPYGFRWRSPCAGCNSRRLLERVDVSQSTLCSTFLSEGPSIVSNVRNLTLS